MKKDQTGQGLLEMVFAIGIMVMVVSSVVALTTASLTGQKESEFQLLSNNLAREGIEVARSIRDSNWLAGLLWDQGLVDPLLLSKQAVIEFDPVSNTWQLNFAVATFTDEIFLDSSGVYSQDDSGSPTIFTRTLTLDDICQDNITLQDIIRSGISEYCTQNERKIGIKVTSSVSWLEDGGQQQSNLSIDVLLYEWK
jgi:type II secretory pathway pseudopilin PulG